MANRNLVDQLVESWLIPRYDHHVQASDVDFLCFVAPSVATPLWFPWAVAYHDVVVHDELVCYQDVLIYRRMMYFPCIVVYHHVVVVYHVWWFTMMWWFTDI